MGKTWILRPDSSRKCCGCAGKTSPCDSCSTCQPLVQFIQDSIYTVDGLPTGTVLCTSPIVPNSLFLLNPTLLKTNSFDPPPTLSFTGGAFNPGLVIPPVFSPTSFKFQLNVKKGEKIRLTNGLSDLQYTATIPAPCDKVQTFNYRVASRGSIGLMSPTGFYVKAIASSSLDSGTFPPPVIGSNFDFVHTNTSKTYFTCDPTTISTVTNGNVPSSGIQLYGNYDNYEYSARNINLTGGLITSTNLNGTGYTSAAGTSLGASTSSYYSATYYCDQLICNESTPYIAPILSTPLVIETGLFTEITFNNFIKYDLTKGIFPPPTGQINTSCLLVDLSSNSTFQLLTSGNVPIELSGRMIGVNGINY